MHVKKSRITVLEKRSVVNIMIDSKKCFLTFDMDWANDEVLEDFYSLLEKYDLKGEINVTHYTKWLELWDRDRLEYGIHPNFNESLFGNPTRSADSIVGELLNIVPGAKTLRSHSLVQSSGLQMLFSRVGIEYEMNSYIPMNEGLCIAPFKSIDEGHMILPFIFEDDIYLNMSEKRDVKWYLSDRFVAPRIFNFHPIHLFLNSDSFTSYEHAKPHLSNYLKLKNYVNTKKYGIRDFFIDLVIYAKKENWEFNRIDEGEW